MLAHRITGVAKLAVERDTYDARLAVFTRRDAWLSERISNCEELIRRLAWGSPRTGAYAALYILEDGMAELASRLKKPVAAEEQVDSKSPLAPCKGAGDRAPALW